MMIPKTYIGKELGIEIDDPNSNNKTICSTTFIPLDLDIQSFRVFNDCSSYVVGGDNFCNPKPQRTLYQKKSSKCKKISSKVHICK